MYYDKISEGYDELHGSEQLNKIKLIKSLIDKKQYLSPFRSPKMLLDLGCGTGITSLIVVPSCFYVGLDPSIKLLRKFTLPRVMGVAESLPFKIHSFDLVISLTAIHHFKETRKVLQQISLLSSYHILSVLKKASQYVHICADIRELFKVIIEQDEEKDTIFFLKNK